MNDPLVIYVSYFDREDKLRLTWCYAIAVRGGPLLSPGYSLPMRPVTRIKITGVRTPRYDD